MARGGLWLGGYLGPTTYLGPPVPMGRASETSSATPVRRVKVRHLGRTNGAIGGYGTAAYGTTPYGGVNTDTPAIETGLARPIARRKLRGIRQPGETSSAAQVRPVKHRRIGPGLERQRARPMRSRKVLEPVVEHDTARPVRPVKVRRIGQAVELAAATAITRRKRRRIGPGKDRQRARPITPT